MWKINTLLKNQQVKEEIKGIIKYFEENENNISKLRDRTKTVLTEMFITITSTLRKKDLKNLNLYIKELE